MKVRSNTSTAVGVTSWLISAIVWRYMKLRYFLSWLPLREGGMRPSLATMFRWWSEVPFLRKETLVPWPRSTCHRRPPGHELRDQHRQRLGGVALVELHPALRRLGLVL